jgi:hypothetical protein
VWTPSLKCVVQSVQRDGVRLLKAAWTMGPALEATEAWLRLHRRAAPALAAAASARALELGIAAVLLRPPLTEAADRALLWLAAWGTAGWRPFLARVPGFAASHTALGVAPWRAAAWAVLLAPPIAAAAEVRAVATAALAGLAAGDAVAAAPLAEGLLPVLRAWRQSGHADAIAALQPAAPLGAALTDLQTTVRAGAGPAWRRPGLHRRVGEGISSRRGVVPPPPLTRTRTTTTTAAASRRRRRSRRGRHRCCCVCCARCWPTPRRPRRVRAAVQAAAMVVRAAAGVPRSPQGAGCRE